MSNYQIERPDWTLFSDLETLSQKSGVPVSRLRRLALKELTDNALDIAGAASITEDSPGCYVIEDDGPGIEGTPQEIARLFSIARPLVSAMLWRNPSRRALGNGLRVVSGALIASGGGELYVETRGQRLKITPQREGWSFVEATPCERTVGTRIEISFGPKLPQDFAALIWARLAIWLASYGKTYSGRPSIWHHDADSFFDLVGGSGERPVCDFITEFDSCTRAKAGQIARDFLNRSCASLTKHEATALLQRARENTQPVTHARLGEVGKIEGWHYARRDCTLTLGTHQPRAHLPFVIEAWAKRTDNDEPHLTAFVNLTPIVAELYVCRDARKRLAIWGCGLKHLIEAPQKGNWELMLNLTTPHTVITSDGKTPDLERLADTILEALGAAILRTRSPNEPNGERWMQKQVVLDNLDAAIDKASGDGKYRFSI